MRHPDEITAEIRACEILLKESDRTIIEALEGLLACTSATNMTAYLKALPDEVKITMTHREGYRQTIAACIAELKAATRAEE